MSEYLAVTDAATKCRHLLTIGGLLQVYVEDSLGERVWVDRQEAKVFVDNIHTAFHTKLPKSLTKSLSINDPSASPSASMRSFTARGLCLSHYSPVKVT